MGDISVPGATLTLSGDGWMRTLESGDCVRFGRGGSGVDLVVAEDDRLHRHCGTIVVHPDGWELENAGSWLRLRVVSTERFGVDSLAPGDSRRVPWDVARVQIFVGSNCVEFSTRFEGRVDDATTVGTVAWADAEESPTLAPVRLDRESAYFRALVALCEPQLLDPCTTDVATDLQIARRLNMSGRESSRATGKTVERRLDACRSKFGLKDTDERGQSTGLERRDARRRLVELALLTGSVSADDLSALSAIDASADVTTR